MPSIKYFILIFAIFHLIANINNYKHDVSSKDQMQNSSATTTTLDDSERISIIMQTILPSMLALFNNITSADFKANFQEPCKFENLLELFKQLPPYFDIISAKYVNKPDIAAYYSMQLASTFLVNNDSLTMTCLYNMLSLQAKLMSFSLNLMNNAEELPHLVGLFGVFMKPMMSMLKQNSMMKIIDYVEKYDKNDDIGTVYLFNILNLIFVFIGTFGIAFNILLVVLLKRSFRRQNPQRKNFKAIKNTETKPTEYDMAKLTNDNALRTIGERYEGTRIFFIIIAICHSLYLLMNFIVMSQASLASVALRSLSHMNFACKASFFLFPPTTAYNLLQQLAIWLLCYAILKHSAKIRASANFNYDDDTSSLNSVSNVISMKNLKEKCYNEKFLRLNQSQEEVIETDSQIQSNTTLVKYKKPIVSRKSGYNASSSLSCYLIKRKNINIIFFLTLTFLLLAYNSHNIMLYSLMELKLKSTNVITFCAFDEAYVDYYNMLSEKVLPLLNVSLFCLLPLLICTIQVLLDLGYLIRVKRERVNHYTKLKEQIEWPLYFYYLIYMITQLPFATHQLNDIIKGVTKFPFVFPLFIQMKFTSKVGLVMCEMTLMVLAYSSDLFVWLTCDKHMRLLFKNWFLKRVLCRTF